MNYYPNFQNDQNNQNNQNDQVYNQMNYPMGNPINQMGIDDVIQDDNSYQINDNSYPIVYYDQPQINVKKSNKGKKYCLV